MLSAYKLKTFLIRSALLIVGCPHESALSKDDLQLHIKILQLRACRTFFGSTKLLLENGLFLYSRFDRISDSERITHKDSRDTASA